MGQITTFISLVIVVKNMAEDLERILDGVIDAMSEAATDFEVLVVDNASEDSTWPELERLTVTEPRLNLRAIGLANRTDFDTAVWAGIEGSIGDQIIALDPNQESLEGLGILLAQINTKKPDVLMLKNKARKHQTLAYKLAKFTLNRAYLLFNGFNLTDDAPQFRMLSKRVVGYLQSQAIPQNAYRNIRLVRGFSQEVLEYSSSPMVSPGVRENLRSSYDRGNRLLFSSSNLPLRLVAFLSLLGAVSNLAYSLYVLSVALTASSVAAGWVSTSLQLSGMFFLISLVLLVLCEYLIHMAQGSNTAGSYFVSGDLTSTKLTRHSQLNISETNT